MVLSDLVLLPAEAKARGFRNTLSFQRWCRRWGVPIRTERTGRLQWVSRAEVDAGAARAIGLDASPANDETTPRPDASAARVASAVARLQGRA